MENGFSAGQVLSKSFDILSKNFPFMLVIGFFASLPTLFTESQPENPTVVFLAMPFSLFATFLLQGVVTFGVYQHLTGQKMALGASWNVALRRLGYLFLVSLATLFLTGLGFLFLVIPGIIISLMLWVAIPVTMVEKGGVGHALSRSRALTTGYRLQIFGITIVSGIISGIASGVNFGIAAAIGTMGVVPGTVSAALISLPVMVVTTGLAAALASVIVTVGYYSLRQEVDGVATEDLASVFE